MSDSQLTLVISDKSDPERDALAAAWEKTAGPVLRLGRFWDPPHLDRNCVRLYGADTYCLVLAQKLELELVSPPDDLIFRLPKEYLKRNIYMEKLREAEDFTYPIFVKPLIPKQFQASIYSSPEDLKKECKGLEPETDVLLSEIVNIEAEARFFVCQNQICSYALYEGDVDLHGAVSIVESLSSTIALPTTAVVDAAFNRELSWFVVEFNASWGAGLNGCDPSLVIPCIKAAVKRNST